MKSDRRKPVAIVGGGFSGTMLAAQLARRGVGSLLIEGGGRAGLGTAYSTKEPAHLLNVRSESMSAWPDRPGDFAAAAGDPRGFAERRLFGRYLQRILDEAVASGHVEVVHSKAVAAELGKDGWRIELEDGGSASAQALALAIGNQPPESFAAAAELGGRWVDNPWSDEAKAAVRGAAGSGGDVLLVGTGLTMVDAVLSLDEAGHRGRIVALSRRGQIPRAHADFTPAPVAAGELPGGLSGLWRWLRERSGEVGWRAAVDSLRPHSQALWQGLGDDEQRRFLRHARPWWDVHRHRIAPEVAGRIAALTGDGRLELVAGRIGSVRAVDGGVEVEIKRRGRDELDVRRFAFVFNCTGPLGAVGRTRDPLLRGLLDGGLVRPDHLGIGLEVDARSRVAGRRSRVAGAQSEAAGAGRLWALGPLTKGRYWEIVAVPDIRDQAAAVAGDIAGELGA